MLPSEFLTCVFFGILSVFIKTFMNFQKIWELWFSGTALNGCSCDYLWLPIFLCGFTQRCILVCIPVTANKKTKSDFLMEIFQSTFLNNAYPGDYFWIQLIRQICVEVIRSGICQFKINKKRCRVVTIAMFCSTIASLHLSIYLSLFIHTYIYICIPVKHLWWSFYCEYSKPLSLFTKKLVDSRLGFKFASAFWRLIKRVISLKYFAL